MVVKCLKSVQIRGLGAQGAGLIALTTNKYAESSKSIQITRWLLLNLGTWNIGIIFFGFQDTTWSEVEGLLFLFLAVCKTTPTFDKLLTSNLLAENQFYDRSCHWTRCCCDPGGKKNIAIFASKQCQNVFKTFSKCQSVFKIFSKCFQSVKVFKMFSKCQRV